MPLKSISKTERMVKAARLSVYSNSALVTSKLAVGIMTSSISVLSEAIHSATDLFAALIANYSVRKSSKPADDLHRFGHGKYESLSCTVEAILILIAAGIIILGAFYRLINPVELQIIEAGMIIMAIGAFLNYFLSRYLMRVAKECQSLALEGDALHLRTDVWTSAGVFLGLLMVRVTGIYEFDPAIALVISIFIINAAIRLTRRSAHELLDHSLTREEEAVIDQTIREIAGDIATYHHLRTRKAGRERFVDFHLVLPKNLPIQKAHRICDEIEAVVGKRLPGSNITIHVEPCDEDCEICRSAVICKNGSE